MTCTISLGPDDSLELRTPSGRCIQIPVSPHSTSMLWQVLWNSSAEHRQVGRHAYATEFPQQPVIDAWARDIMPQRTAEREAELAEERETKRVAKLAETERKLGVKLDELDFDI